MMFSSNPCRPFLLFFPLALLLGYASSSFAAAWVQPYGETYMSLAFSEYRSDWYWDEAGERKRSNDGTYRKREIKFYAEHGLTEDITLILSLPWQRAEKLEPSDLSETAFHDIEFGMRRRLWARGFETALMAAPPGIAFGI